MTGLSGRATVVLVVFVFVFAGASQAWAAPSPTGSSSAVRASKLITAPHGGALVTSTSVRVVVRHRAGAKTRVQLGSRDVTRRFRTKGRSLVGTLRHGDGLRHGRNHLFVTSKRRGKAAERHARSFFFLRRSTSFLRVGLHSANPARLRIDVVSGARRGTLIRRPRTTRVRLNGRLIGRALIARSGTRWTTSLSATHGLRHGLNRLQVFVAEPQSGRYASISRSFRVRRDRPLAAAGLDHGTRPGAQVRLGDRHRAARGGRLRYQWTLVAKPPGSRAEIAGATSARPLLVPDGPGRYVARVRVTEHGRGRASAAQLGGASVDDTSVSVGPAGSLMSLSANAGPDGKRGIQIGEPGDDAGFHEHPGPKGTIQYLALERQTLKPIVNTFCCAEPDAVQGLVERQEAAGADQLVVVVLPPIRDTLPPAQYDAFNKVLEGIGVAPLAYRDFGEGRQIVAVGVPSGGERSGSIIRRHTEVGTGGFPRMGWLMLDGDLNAGYRFQPLRVAFDTSSQSTATSNTMTLGSATVTSPPVDARAGAFHLVEVDPVDLSVVRNLSFANDAAGREGLGSAIRGASEHDRYGNVTGVGNYIALQSIGRFAPVNPEWDISVARSLVEIGASPHHFNFRSDRYAFFGGARLGAKGAAQSNAGVVADPVGPVFQTGTLSGEAGMDDDGFVVLPTGAATDGAADSLYEVIFNTVGQPFPYTTGPEADDYDKALRYISGQLSTAYDFSTDFAPPGGQDFSTNIRAAYLGLPEYGRWGNALAALDKIEYPGAASAPPCTSPSDIGNKQPGFTPTQFSCLKAQLKKEFAALVTTKEFTDDLVTAVELAAGQDQDVLHTTYAVIKEAVDKPDGEFGGPLAGLIKSLAELAHLAEIAGGGEIALAAAFAKDIVELSEAIATLSEKPVGETLEEKVADLGAKVEGEIAAAAASLDSIRATALSDWGRMQAFEEAAGRAATSSRTHVTDQLANASGRYFTSALVEDLESEGRYRSFRIYTDGTGNDGPDPLTCRTYLYRGATKGVWVPFLFSLDSWSSLVYGWPGSTLVSSSDFPPEEIMSQMFGSPRRRAPIAGLGSGYGIEKTSWFWQQADWNTTRFREAFDLCGG